MTLQTYNMAPAVAAFSTTREGGHSRGNYSSFNVNPYCGDDPESVRLNRNMLCTSLGISHDKLIIPHQTHGTEIKLIDQSFLSQSTLEDGDDETNNSNPLLEGIDALITSQTKVCISVSTADCIPILIYDSAHHAIAAIHAGWRGTAANIVGKTLDSMNKEFGTEGKDCKAIIGPGISIDSFEVGEEVYERFAETGFYMPDIARRYSVRNAPPSLFATKWHIDLPEANRIQLMEKKVNGENIIDCHICTYSNSDTYFSARKLGTYSGRILTGIMMNK
ncbi:MAG: peptidoglycan editing factor PgeF [Bacteroides sp.]|nr:peptidoglycan editing factor PgeF [Roseburia sp.]MCM1347722.1 peptidoglycan editing factor PgeF [Bacteroides sp.]MCM1421648.1 peptidoglycan editing factor PgeF [Bacteroides sp.]